MTTSQLKNVSVDITGLLKVLGENLYSRPEVAIRELIQNASDAITRRQLQFGDDFTPRIDVICNPQAQTLEIRDTGSGLTKEEIDQFLARIGAGFTRSLRKETSDSGLIGAFGLGFLTAYMIGGPVEVRTTPVGHPDKACRFVSENGESYAVSAMDSGQEGSHVIIHLKDKFAYFADIFTLRGVVEDYCRLMSVPIYIQNASEPINVDPPWRLEAANEPEVRLAARRKTFAEMMEPRFEPIATIPIHDPENPSERGLLWMHDTGTYGGQDNRWMQIYIRGMMVARNKHDFLPSWAGFVSGVFESHKLSPTASREDLIEDPAYFAAKNITKKALTTGLAEIARNRPEIWRRIMRRHNDALLGAAIADSDLFEAIIDDLNIPTSEGPMTLPEIAKRSPKGLMMSLDSSGGADEVVARAFGAPVIFGYRYGAARVSVNYAFNHGLEVIELGTREGHQKLFPKVSVSAKLESAINTYFKGGDYALLISEFDPEFLSTVCFVDADQQLKDYYESDAADKSLSAGILGLARNYTSKIEKTSSLQLVVNANSPLIQGLASSEPEAARAAARTLTAFARLASSRQSLGGSSYGEVMQDMNESLINLMESTRTKS